MWDYVRKNEVPYHELFDHGYASIGCAPCTRPVQPGETERAGRWWWESETDKECGIHCTVGLLGSKSDRERLADVAAVRTASSGERELAADVTAGPSGEEAVS